MNLSQASTSSILDILSIISENKQKVISFLQQFFPLNKNIYKKSKNYFFNKCFNSLILSLIIKDLSSFESAPPLRAQASDFVNINCPMTRLCARRSFSYSIICSTNFSSSAVGFSWANVFASKEEQVGATGGILFKIPLFFHRFRPFFNH